MVWERERDLLVDGCRALIKATGEACTVLMGKETDAGSQYAVKLDTEAGIHFYFYTDIVILGGC